MHLPIPDKSYLEAILTYEPEGLLRWKARPREVFKTDRQWRTWNTSFAGKLTGQRSTMGYRQLMIDGVRLLEHRVIAALHGMPIDGLKVDHIDGDTRNNKLSNLRVGTQQQNTMNNRGWRGKAQRVGVHKKANGRFVAYVRAHGKHTHLGTYHTEGEAIAARVAAEKMHYGCFAISQSRDEFIQSVAVDRGVQLDEVTT